MSRMYEIHVQVDDLPESLEDTVIEACNSEWSFTEWYNSKEKEGTLSINGYGEDSLGGGESPEEFCQRLTDSIWSSINTYALITVTAMYVEEVLLGTWEFDKLHFNRWKRKSKKNENSRWRQVL